MPTIRTRAAPSPTGYLHVGTARLSLFNYLFAKKLGGSFILRIEDTDRERSDKKFEEEIFESLDWLGIRPDESSVAGGSFGPYRDSERIASHSKYLKQLLDKGAAFYCPHSVGELEAEKKKLMEEKKNPIHVCNHRETQGTKEGIIRFKTPMQGDISFSDLIRGEIHFDSSLIGDFSLAKDLETPLYNMAVVADDYDMKISHVFRGEDHISNTPKQMLIWTALWPDEPMPQFAHLPLILAPDRSKLSKRHGATSIREFREQGYLPEALVNFMALLGWNPGTDKEFFELSDLVREFDIGRVQKSGAIFNIEKLEATNGAYIRKKSVRELTDLARSFLESDIPETKHASREKLEAIVALEQPRLTKLSEIGERVEFLFRDPAYDVELLRWKSMTNDELRATLERSRRILDALAETDYETELLAKRFFAEIGAGDKGPVLWPLRVALSGKKASPPPFEIMAILGKAESIKRIDRAMAMIQS